MSTTPAHATSTPGVGPGAAITRAAKGLFAPILLSQTDGPHDYHGYRKTRNYYQTHTDVTPLNATTTTWVGQKAIFEIPKVATKIQKMQLLFNVDVQQTSTDKWHTFTSLVGGAAYAAIDNIVLRAAGQEIQTWTGEDLFHLDCMLKNPTQKAYIHECTGLLYGQAGLDDAGVTAYNRQLTEQPVPEAANASLLLPPSPAYEAQQQYASRGAIATGTAVRVFCLDLDHFYWDLNRKDMGLPVCAMAAELRLEVTFSPLTRFLFTNQPTTAQGTNICNLKLRLTNLYLTDKHREAIISEVNHTDDGVVKKIFGIEGQRQSFVKSATAGTAVVLSLPNLRAPTFVTVVMKQDKVTSSQQYLAVPFLLEALDTIQMDANSGPVFPVTDHHYMTHKIIPQYLPSQVPSGYYIIPHCHSIVASLTDSTGYLDIGNLFNPTITIQKSVVGTSTESTGINVDTITHPRAAAFTSRDKYVHVINLHHQLLQERNGTLVRVFM